MWAGPDLSSPDGDLCGWRWRCPLPSLSDVDLRWARRGSGGSNNGAAADDLVGGSGDLAAAWQSGGWEERAHVRADFMAPAAADVEVCSPVVPVAYLPSEWSGGAPLPSARYGASYAMHGVTHRFQIRDADAGARDRWRGLAGAGARGGARRSRTGVEARRLLELESIASVRRPLELEAATAGG